MQKQQKHANSLTNQFNNIILIQGIYGMQVLSAKNWIKSMGSVPINIIYTYEQKYPFNWLMVANVKGF